MKNSVNISVGRLLAAMTICMASIAMLTSCGGGNPEETSESGAQLLADATATTSWTLCANENQYCSFSGGTSCALRRRQ